MLKLLKGALAGSGLETKVSVSKSVHFVVPSTGNVFVVLVGQNFNGIGGLSDREKNGSGRRWIGCKYPIPKIIFHEINQKMLKPAFICFKKYICIGIKPISIPFSSTNCERAIYVVIDDFTNLPLPLPAQNLKKPVLGIL